MHRTKIVRSRLLAAVMAVALVASTQMVLTVAPVAADTAPPVTTPPTPTTVSADALPTVQIDGVVWAQVVVGSTVYAAGSFATARPAGSAAGVNTVTRNNLLAYNIDTGVLVTSFAPNLNGQALAIAASPDGTRLYVGGDFTTADGSTRSRIAAYNLTTNTLVANFKPLAATTVRAIAATNSTVYFGGDFTTVNGVARPRLAAVDVATGNLLNWNPNADSAVTAMTMTVDGSKLVVGGRFANMGGNPWYGMAALDPTSGLTVPWAATNLVRNAGTQASITSLTASSDGVYGSGYVFGAGGNLEGVFRADPSTGNVLWIEDCHGDTYSVYAGNPDAVYVASHEHYCGNIGGFPQTPLPWATYRGTAFSRAATQTITADPYGYFNWAGNPAPSLLNWFPTFTTGTYTGQGQAGWSVTGNSKYTVFGGEFPTVNGAAQQGLVRFAVSSAAPNKIGPDSNDQLTPSVVSLQAGSVRVAWLATFDRDNTNLTYKVYRNFKSLADTPIYTTTANNTFWQRSNLGFTDKTVVPGQSYNYRVYVFDPFGNSASRGATTITVPTGTAGSQTYPNAVLADSPNTYWRLGDSATTTAYDYANFNDGVKSAGVTQSTDGIVTGDANTASSFDGASDGFISSQTATPAPNTLSVESWVKTNTTSGGKIIGYGAANTGNSSSYDRQVYMDNLGRVFFGVYTGAVQTINSAPGFNDNQWHQIVATLGSNGMQLFIDGKRVAARTDVTAGQPYSGFWRVGGDSLNGWTNQPTSSYLAGLIDEVAIYPAVLTQTQINNHYTASGRTSPVVQRPSDAYGQAVYDLNPDLFWRLNETSGAAVAADSGPAGNAGNVGSGVTLGTAGALSGQSTTAGLFNGSTGGTVIEQNSQPGTTVYSEAVWFKTTTTVGGKLIGFGDAASGLSGSYDRHVYMQDNGQLVFGTYTGQLNTATSLQSYNDGTWHLVVATQGSNGMILYVDGQSVATNPQTSAQAYSGYWRIGGDNTWGSSSAYFAGTLDEAAVFGSTLTGAQVAGLYGAGSAGPPNRSPVAAFTSSTANLAASFDGSGSADPDGTIASYSWNFGDSSTLSTAMSPSHTYAAAGTYVVALTVTDNAGGTNTVTHNVTVVSAGPVPFAQDLFGRSVTSGLGAADLGGAWTLSGGNTAFAVNGSAAQVTMAAATSSPTASLASVSSANTDVRVDLSLNKPPTGGGVFVSLVGRRISSTNDYRAHVNINAAGQVTLNITKRISSTETVLTTKAIPGLIYAVGTTLTVRFQVSGTTSTTLNARVWKTGTTEPATWQLSVVDTTAVLQGPGGLGLVAYLSGTSTNAPVVATFDNLLAQPTN